MHFPNAKKRFIRMIMFSLISSVALSIMLFSGSTAINLQTAETVPCDNARSLDIGETLEQSDSWSTNQSEWITFKVQAGSRYLLQVSNADGLNLAIHDRCSANSAAVAVQNGQIEFSATRNGEYYLLVSQAAVSNTSSMGYQAALLPAEPIPPSTISADEVPTDVLRRATEFLEELRGSDLAPEWANARINSEVRVLYRPDIQGPAYYEVTVEKPVGDVYESAGYIQLASGDHDYTITNWNTTGKSTTEDLANLAPLGATITQVFRLNAETFAAEYQTLSPIGLSVMADDVVNLGDIPVQSTGLEDIPDAPYPLVTTATDSENNNSYDGPAPLTITETPWESWAALKAGYGQEYNQLNRSLMQRASNQWQLEENLKQYGETLIKGNVRTIYGLAANTLTSIQVTGDGAGAQYLKQELMYDGAVLKGVILTVLDEPADKDTLLPIQVVLAYAEGGSETLKFAIANQTAMTYVGVLYLPIVVTRGNKPAATESPAPDNAATWGPWHYYWVDSKDDALAETYNQIPAYTNVNTSGCYSGCAATGWSMLFTWVDRRAAAGHPTWAGHWGMYRVNGGYGSNDVAPLTQNVYVNNGVNNMSWELRNRLTTYCSGTSGSTDRDDEIKAAEYYRPRATAAWRMSTRYDPTGLCWFGACDAARGLITDQIIYRHAPAILGAYNHIQMAVGYAWQSEQTCFLWWCSTDYNRWFYINKGWGGSGNGWLDYDDVYLGGTFNNY